MIPMSLFPEQTTEPCQDLYFTLKYVAGYRERAPITQGRREFYTGGSLDQMEQAAQYAIDEILRRPLPEVQLWREREQLEARLFGEARQYSPFL